MKEEVYKCIEILKKGGIILYPTDTIWGIGCDATNEEAVQKIFDLKGRDSKKSMITLVEHDGRLQRHLKHVPDVAWELIDSAEKPLTIIFPQPVGIAKNLIADDNSAAFRITKDSFCNRLIHTFNRPIVSTSANLSGAATPKSFIEITPAILKTVDYVVNLRREETEKKAPSSIIKLALNGEIEIVRK